MTIFELVKIALDELYQEGQEEYGDDLDDAINDRMVYLSKSYGQLNNENRTPVNYKDPATRFAYVYKYVAAHGDYVVQLMERLRDELDANIFKAKNVRVSCVGGGPGSDIVGVLKYLDEYEANEPVEKVTCYLLDKEQAWADTWTELDESLGAGVSLNANFQPLDVTNPESWESQKKFLQADIFTFSYFVSEVFSLDDGTVAEFFGNIFEKAKPGALFLYIDNGHSDFNDYFDERASASDMECLISQTNVSVIPRYSEQASELSSYISKFGQHPKIRSTLSFRVIRKPS